LDPISPRFVSVDSSKLGAKWMNNFILQNKAKLAQDHYLLLANQADHWFNASPGRVKDFQAKHGDDFCLVLYRDGPNNDVYVIPYRRLKGIFTEENLVPGPKGTLRWHGT